MKRSKILRRFIGNLANLARRRPAILLTNILLTKNCTQRCLQCSIPLETGTDSMMTLKNFKKLIDKLDSYGTQAITLSGGDPMLHPHLRDCIEYARSKHFGNIHLLTTLYGPDKLVERTIDTVLETGVSISISFDGFGEIADKLRGGKDVAAIVMKNLESLHRRNIKLKKPVRTGANIVINNLNLHQVPKILDYLESLRWHTDVDIYRWASTNQQEMEPLKLLNSLELQEVIKRVKASPVVFTPDWLFDGFEDYLNGKSPKLCPYLLSPALGSKFFIDPDGAVKVCIGESVGNIFQNSPEEIFESELWQQKIIEFKGCKGCWNTCYTTSARPLHIGRIKDLKKVIRATKFKHKK
ncbi:MAG: radical SAM protein [Calditrichaeota bacterium]|nr:radical SAM protein [Calditrichota bacterium]